MPKTNGNSKTNGHKNGHGRNGNGNGRKALSPQQAKLARLAVRQQAVEMFLEGVSVAEIANALGVGARTVALFVEDARKTQLDRYQDYFADQVAYWLDQKLAALQEMSTLLADREWLQTADTARIETILEAIDVCANTVVMLSTRAGRHNETQRLALAAPATDAGSGGSAEG